MTGLAVGLAVLGVSLLVVLLRFVLGPSSLDRLVALDAMVAVILSGLMVLAALTGDSALVPVVVATSLVGFLGSSTVARFLSREGPDEAPAPGDTPDVEEPS